MPGAAFRLNMLLQRSTPKQTMSFDPHDPRIAAGIRLFNEREFFPCHDVFEDLWSELVGPEKLFFQGLIHAAVCLYHFEGDNLTGARRMYISFVTYVSDFAPVFCDIDVEKLLADMEHCFEELLAASGGYPHGLKLQPNCIPLISLRG
jgi:hypothetical protein